MAINPFSREGPFSIRDLQNEFDRMVDRLWHGGLSTPPLDGYDWAPPLDVVDEPLRYLVRVEIPGMGPTDVDVAVLDRTLTIKGTKPSWFPVGEQRRFLRAECRYGAFRRELELGVPVDAEKVVARVRNGVLEVEIPKKETARGHTVKIDG